MLRHCCHVSVERCWHRSPPTVANEWPAQKTALRSIASDGVERTLAAAGHVAAGVAAALSFSVTQTVVLASIINLSFATEGALNCGAVAMIAGVGRQRS